MKIDAKEAREMTATATNNRESETWALVENYIDNVVTKYIKEAAQNGDNIIRLNMFYVDRDTRGQSDAVKKVLVSNGYTVTFKNNEDVMVITW